MPFEITMPQLGLTMEKGTVVEWLIGVGDRFSAGQEVLRVETDKAIVAVEAHQVGTLGQILVPEGRHVPVGTVLALATAPGEAALTQLVSAPIAASGAAAPPIAPPPAAGLASPPATLAQPAGVKGTIQASWKARAAARKQGIDLRSVAASGPNGRIVARDVEHAQTPPAAALPEGDRATPVAARLAADLGLDLAAVRGSGPQGKVTQSDVLQAAAAIIRSQTSHPSVPAPGPAQVATGIPLKGLRKLVSERMAASVHSTARVTLVREVDATRIVDLREQLKALGQPVSFNDILTRACAMALRERPEANARLGGEEIEVLDAIHIGVATDTERGLLVPVIRNAGTLTLQQIAAESARLIEAARTGRSKPDDLTGGTFTITNLGMLGVDAFTPVINLPECCILGVGRIVRKPVVCDERDTVAVRAMMTLSLVFDHRVIDGAPAARLLDRIATLIEYPLPLVAR